jgi:competence protein ComEC
VLPSLHALGIARLDLLMVSHADNDHAGGAPAVAAAFPQARRLAGEPERIPIAMPACHAGQAWQWDGVRFSVLSPLTTQPGGVANDRSCVLQVQGTDGMLLLTGDIDSSIEPAVAAAASKDDLPLVLLVPHHGSRSSSSVGFIDALRPMLALVSAGWRNRFGHPTAEVVQRYAQAGVPLLNTAEQGAIQVDFPAGAPPQVRERWRTRHPRYWRE